MLNPRAKSILDYWFGELDLSSAYLKERNRLWFWGEEETDRTIRERFLADVETAARGDLRDWEATPRGALARVILLDQFSMNLWRDQARCYTLSAEAIPIAKKAIDRGFDWAVTPAERVFFYLPLEHSEVLEDQDYSVMLFKRLAESAPTAYKDAFDGYLDYAVRHHRVVARYGRFPDRNEAFGRASSAEEIAFLASDEAPF